MNASIIDLQRYTSSSRWRRPEQLRGLLRNHPDVVADSGPLAPAGVLFGSAQVCLHSSERAAAVALAPVNGGGSVGLMPLPPEGPPSLAAAARMRWLDLAGGLKPSSVCWHDALAFVGTSQGRVLVVDAPAESATGPSGALTPCGALATAAVEPALGDITVPPSSHAASTTVRSLQSSADGTRVLGVKGGRAYVWDLAGGALPAHAWAPDPAEYPSTLLFARWAPQTAAVVLTGSYSDGVCLTDTRAAPGAANGLRFSTHRGCSVPCGDFNAILPFTFACGVSDGNICVFDVRVDARPVMAVPALQGDVTCLQWLRLQPDMLLTGGTDGSVSIWNLRHPPTFCVGRAQYQLPLTSLAATSTYTQQRAIGVTLGAELTLTGLSDEATMGLAPPPMTFSAAGGAGGAAAPAAGAPASALYRPENADRLSELRERERRAAGLLYTRRLGEAFTLACECATERFAWKDSEAAMRMVTLIDVTCTPAMDYDALIARRTAEVEGALRAAAAAAAADPSGANDSDATPPPPRANRKQEFEMQLLRYASRLCTTVPLDVVRDLSRPRPEDLRRLEALRLNVVLHRVLAATDNESVASGVQQTLALLGAHPESFELIEIDIVCGIVRLLLGRSVAEGERFVRFLASLLQRVPSSETATGFMQRILTAAQEPLITAGASGRATRQFEESFFRDMRAAEEAVLVQLAMLKLGASKPKEVIAAAAAYQRGLKPPNVGMLGWMAVQPLVLYLRCLAADSNYVLFFWTSVQYIDVFAHFPAVREVEEVLFSVVDRIYGAAAQVSADLEGYADLERYPVPTLRQIDGVLRNAHAFLMVLIGVQLECENVAVANGLGALPPVMEKVQKVLDTASEDVLDSWAAVLDSLTVYAQAEVVRKFCLASVRAFSFQVEELMDVSQKGEHDERLNEILDVCDDFMENVGTGATKQSGR